MSVQDFRDVSKNIISGSRVVNVGTTAEQIIAQSKDREVLIIGPPSAGIVTIFPDPEVSVRSGIIMRWDCSWLWLSGAKDGNIVKERWFAILETGLGPITDRWHESNAAVAGTATATHAAVAARRHQIEGVQGTFSDGIAIAVAEVQVNGAQALTIDVNGAGPGLPFNRAVEGAANQSVGLSLASGGVGITGNASVWGVTVDAGDGGANMSITEGVVVPPGFN